MDFSYEGAKGAACNLEDYLYSLITIDRLPSDQGPMLLPRSGAVVKLGLLRAQRQDKEARFHLRPKMRPRYIRRETAFLEEEELVGYSSTCPLVVNRNYTTMSKTWIGRIMVD